MGNGITKYICPKCSYGRVATRIVDGYIHVWCRRCDNVYIVKDDIMLVKAELNRNIIKEAIKKRVMMNGR